MIVDAPIVTDMALGVERRIMQDGDAQLIFPASIQPVTQAVQQHNVQNVPATLTRTSAIANGSRSNTNSIATSTDVLTVAKGLWEFEVHLSALFNYTAPGGLITGARATLSYQAFTITLINLWPFIGAQSQRGHFKLLLNNGATFSLALGVTGVGETIDGLLFVNAVRIL